MGGAAADERIGEKVAAFNPECPLQARADDQVAAVQQAEPREESPGDDEVVPVQQAACREEPPAEELEAPLRQAVCLLRMFRLMAKLHPLSGPKRLARTIKLNLSRMPAQTIKLNLPPFLPFLSLLC